MKTANFLRFSAWTGSFQWKICGFHPDYWKDLCLGVFPSISSSFHMKTTNFHKSCQFSAVFSMKTGSLQWKSVVFTLIIGKIFVWVCFLLLPADFTLKTASFHWKSTGFHEPQQISVKTGGFHLKTSGFHWNPQNYSWFYTDHSLCIGRSRGHAQHMPP